MEAVAALGPSHDNDGGRCGRKIDHRVDRDFVTNATITASSETAAETTKLRFLFPSVANNVERVSEGLRIGAFVGIWGSILAALVRAISESVL